MKRISAFLPIVLFTGTVFAQQTIRPDGAGGWVVQDTGGCGGLFGAAQGACIAEQQREQQQQAQQQQLIQQQQIENQRLQNELLRRQLEQQSSTGQVDYSKTPEFRSWQAANPWFGSDRPKTEFALLYAKQLRQERPDLVGRAFFDAVSAKVAEVFNAKK
ncbi:hypothetical protein [Trinickia acidisoli]|uniref:hypothetical protein n=1 Tax=Trinickia acidisoli TaxID=2767482 RepID=UPI001A8C422C|nr:hypothetical protein [Trinickia acidisoli]